MRGQQLEFTINKTSAAHEHKPTKLTQAEISHKVDGEWGSSYKTTQT